MKYIKMYEKRKKPEVSFKIGDHVTPIEDTGNSPEFDIIKGVIYTIIKIYSNEDKTIEFQSSTNPYHICDVENEDGKVYKVWYLKRFRSAEAEYNSNKFNI